MTLIIPIIYFKLIPLHTEEWIVDDQRCLLDELKGDCTVTLVDIGQYLLKGKEEKSLIVRNFPDDPNVLKSILKQVKCNNTKQTCMYHHA